MYRPSMTLVPIVFGASETHQLVEIGAVKLFVEDRAV